MPNVCGQLLFSSTKTQTCLTGGIGAAALADGGPATLGGVGVIGSGGGLPSCGVVPLAAATEAGVNRHAASNGARRRRGMRASTSAAPESCSEATVGRVT